MTPNVYTKFIDKNNNPLAFAYCLSVTAQINLYSLYICLEHLLYTSGKLHILEVSEVSKLIYVKYVTYAHIYLKHAYVLTIKYSLWYYFDAFP